MAGAGAGLVAGTVMAMAMMMFAISRHQSIWTMPNLIAAMWFGPPVATGQPGFPTIAGFLTHEVTSILMGMIALAWVAGLTGRRLFLASLAYALASYPLVFSTVISWANPAMYQRAPMIDMTWGHMIYGMVFAVAYTFIVRRSEKTTD
ncbi:MAG: hypothetical protein M3Q09_01495 [Gemmatimonadota bacterium]|nr:hypothetical protein [Gemmatimonadota bacterium]